VVILKTEVYRHGIKPVAERPTGEANCGHDFSAAVPSDILLTSGVVAERLKLEGSVNGGERGSRTLDGAINPILP
jgi:hypothetical protein